MYDLETLLKSNIPDVKQMVLSQFYRDEGVAVTRWKNGNFWGWDIISKATSLVLIQSLNVFAFL